MANRVLPAANAVLWDPGAEGYAIEPGFDVYDIPSRRIITDKDTFGQRVRAWTYNTSQRLINQQYYERSVESIKDINVISPKVRVNYQDINLNHWTFYGGSWESFKPLEPTPGLGRKARMVQRSATKNQIARAESLFLLPANCNGAFTVQRLAAKHDNDETNYPAKVQVVICDLWAVRFSSGEDAGIWRKLGGQWTLERKIELADKNKEYLVTFCVRRGAICFQINNSDKFEVGRDELPLSLPEGQIVVEGVSCQFTFGWHQAAFDQCWYETYDLPVFEFRLGQPQVDLSQTYRPIGTSIVVSFLPSAPATVKYRVTMTPNTFLVTNNAFEFYDVPEVWGILVYWDTILASPTGGSTNLVSLGLAEAIDIVEDEKINQRSGEITLDWEVDSVFSGTYGWRMLEIELGYYMDDDTWVYNDRGVFYVIEPETRAQEFSASISFPLVDLYIRAELTLVDEGWRPLDGMTCIQARNYVMLKMGLPISRASWLNTGAVLPNGLPDDPRWWPQPGMTAAEILEAIDLWEWTETFVAADGTWTSRPRRYVDAAVSFTFDGEGADKRYAIENLRYRAEHREVKTAWLAAGRDERQGFFWATQYNYNLERMPATPGFVGFRIWERQDSLELFTLAQAVVMVNQMRSVSQDVPQRPELTIPGLPNIYRGFRFKLDNADMTGAVLANEFSVNALDFRWRPYKADTKTTILGRRVL